METGILIADTSFDQAREYFIKFLSGQGLSSDLLWLFREDVIFQRKHIFIKTPVPTENESLAEQCYELERKRDFGVDLHAFCLLESRPCCYIVLPEDDIDAGRMLMSKVTVKYSVWTDLRKAEPISTWVKWQTLKLLNNKSNIGGFDGYIPSKHNLLPEYRVAGAG